MEKLVQQVKHFWNDEAGATAVEYGMLVALIAAVIIIAVQTLGTNLNGVFTYVSGLITTP